MKIKKSIKPVTAASEEASAPDKTNVNFSGKYALAQKSIMDAITELTKIVSIGEDEIASDSIANLSVVLLDLQGGK